MIENFTEKIAKVDDILQYNIVMPNLIARVEGVNLSDGTGIYKNSSRSGGATDLYFKSLRGAGGLSIADDGEQITLTSQSSPPVPQLVDVPGIYNNTCISTGLLSDGYKFSNVDNLYIYITSISVMRINNYPGTINYGLDPLILYSGPCINKLFTNLPFVCIKLSDVLITCSQPGYVVMNLTGTIVYSIADISDNLDLINTD